MTATTVMRNSIVGDAWIQEVCRQNPAGLLPGDQRLITTGPCRLSFCDLFTPKAPMNQPNATPKYSTAALYTPYTDMSVFYAEYYRVCAEMFPDYYNPHINNGAGGYSGLEVPFHDCATKAHKLDGYTPGLMYINHTSKFKPPIVDATPSKNPITDPSKVYPGVWAILVLNAYGYGKSPPQPKKGVSFGLQAVMIIGDDSNLSGGGVDAKAVFAGAVVRPPAVAPGSLAGLVPPVPGQAPVAPPPVGVRPVATTGAFAPPPPPTPMHATIAAAPVADDDLSSLY